MDLLDAGRRRWWMSAAAVLLLIVAAVVVVVLWLSHRGGPAPADVAREFLDARSCSRVEELADPDYRARITESDCGAIVDGARGRRTFADPDRSRDLTRTLALGRTVEREDETEVSFTAHYTERGRALPDETVVVVLRPHGDGWLVDRWGLAS